MSALFVQNEFVNVWKIETLELLYNTADSLFRDSEKGNKNIPTHPQFPLIR